MNTVIYARYSSDKQTEQSIEGQLQTCHDYAKRSGYSVVGEYIDRAITGKMDSRLEFQRLITDSAKKQFQAVIVYAVDRFGRNLQQSVNNEYKLQKNGVALMSATENFADNPAGRMHRNMMMTFAQYYSDELGQKVTRGMYLNAEKCLYNGGGIPLGYKIVDKKLHIDEDTVFIVQRIFEMYANGMRVIDITDHLNAQQIKTSSGADFNNSSLHCMLKNKKYIGTYTYGEIEIPDGIPRIISDELFYRVADVMAENKKRSNRVRAKEEYLLTTKLFCGHCKSLMVGVSGKSSTGKAYHYYSCNNARQKLCNKKNASKQELEDLVIQECRNLLTSNNIKKIADEVAAYCERESETSNLKRLNKLLIGNNTAMENLLKAMEQGQNIDIINERITAKRKEQEDLKTEIAKERIENTTLTVPDIRFFLTQLKNGNINDIKHRRTLINVLVNAIHLYDDRITLILNAGDIPITIDDIMLDEIERNETQNGVRTPNSAGHHFETSEQYRLWGSFY